MASFRFPSLRRAASKTRSRRRSGKPQSASISSQRRFRRLTFDPLEERALLTVAPVNTTDMLVNNPAHYNAVTALSSFMANSYSNLATTTNQQTMATDDAGDYVIAWVGSDVAFNPGTESQWVDPANGNGINDQNVYARYFTQEVQSLDLTQVYSSPASQLSGSKTPTVSLYFGQEVQELSITTSAGSAVGRFYLSYNGVQTANPIYFDDSLRLSGPGSNAEAIQNALQALGVSMGDAPLSQVTVAAIDARDFSITFPTYEGGALPTYYPIQVVTTPVDLSSALAKAIAATDTTITLTGAPGADLAYPATILVGSGATAELMTVTGADPADPTGDTLEVTRGVDGTTAIAHAVTDKIMKVDAPFGTLSGAVTAGAATIKLTNPLSPASTVFPFTILVGTGATAELMTATGFDASDASDATLDVTRGVDHTTARAHAKNDPVALLEKLAAGAAPLFQGAADPASANFTGYPAAVEVVETSKAFEIGPIPISPTSPTATATAIEQYFVLAADANTPTASVGGDTPEAPISTATPQTTVPVVYPGTVPSVPNYPGTAQTVPSSTALPQIAVAPDPTPSDPTGLYHYTITFQNDWGMEDHPALYVAQATTGAGASVLASPVALTIVKESSQEFRVNAPEPNNPSIPYPAATDQTNPQVAMDATGDFVITWQSVVPTVTGSYTDIFARRFSPTAYVNTLNGTATTFLSEATPYQPTQWRVSTTTTVEIGPLLPITFDVTSSAGFPAAGPFNIEVDGEMLTVATVSIDPTNGATQWTLTAPPKNYHDAFSPVFYIAATTTLSSFVLATDTTITVASTAGFPAAGPFYVLVDAGQLGGNALDGEVMLVTSVSGDTWTVQRGALATTPTFHANNAPVEFYDVTPAPTTLAATTTATATTVALTSIAGFPDPLLGDFTITVGNEVMIVTGVSGATYTVIRGQNGTAAVAHSAGALVEIDDMTPVECVQPMGNQFQVNVVGNTANPQSKPTVAMDQNGNFAIAWQNTGQPLSFFNNITAQRYDSNGDPVGGNFRVNTELTAIEYNAHVAIDNQGDLGITWSETQDPNYFKGLPFTSLVDYKVIAANGNVLVPETPVPDSSGGSTIAFDSNDNFAISWDVLTNSSNTGGAWEDVLASEFQLYQRDANNNIVHDANGNPIVANTQIRATFRVNSASFNINSKAAWPLDQSTAQVAIDSDGDITVSYDGFGPDVSVNVDLAEGYFAQILAEPQNADIAGFFAGVPTGLAGHPGGAVGMYGYQLSPVFYPQYDSNGSVDGVINAVMLLTWTQLEAAGINPETGASLNMTPGLPGSPTSSPSGMSASQLGRVWQIANDVAGMLRGEANGVMFSQFDTAPSAIVPGAAPAILYSDSIANNQRDGSDQVDYVVLNRDTANGSFVLNVTNGITGASTNVPITVVSVNNVLLPEQTAAAIQTALDTATGVGINWPKTSNANEGPVDVRYLLPAETLVRNGVTVISTDLTKECKPTDTTITVDSATAKEFAYLFADIAAGVIGSFDIFVYTGASTAEEMTVTGEDSTGLVWTVVRGVNKTVAQDFPGPKKGTPPIPQSFVYLADDGGGTGWGSPYAIGTSPSGAPLAVDINGEPSLGADPYYFDNYVFEITFQGEVHDTPMGLTVVSSNLTQAPTSELQQIVLTGGPFTLTTFATGIVATPTNGFEGYTVTYNGQQITGLSPFDAFSPTGVSTFASAIAGWLNSPPPSGGFPAGSVTFTADQPVGTLITPMNASDGADQINIEITAGATNIAQAFASFSIPFYLVIGTELVEVTSVGAGTLDADGKGYDYTMTVLRAQGGYTEVAHNAGDSLNTAGGDFTLIFPPGQTVSPITITPTQPGAGSQNPPTPEWSASVKVTPPTTPPAAAPVEGTEIGANEGTPQADASVAMTPGGDYTMTWTQYNDQAGTYNTNVYYRQFQENTVTAGPQAESFELASSTAPGGVIRLQSPTPQVVTASNLNYIVVTFDENMMTSGPSSVTNPQNWALLENGSLLVGGIQQIYFGLNEAAMLSQTAQYASLGLSATGSDKFEAVLILNGSGAFDAATGLHALAAGNYTITALNSLRDVDGNPLGRSGYTPNGYSISRSFNILTPTAGQSQVDDPVSIPATTDVQSPETIAMDGNGDAVVVWTGATKTLLTTNVTAAAGTISVAGTINFPAAPFNIYVDNEEMEVTGFDATGLVWTVTRGINGTTAAAHTADAVVMLAGGNTAGVYAQMYQATWKTALASAVASAASTTISVASAAGFPTGNVPFNILIDSEVMTVTAVSGTSWTVTRGVNGTGAAAHLIGAIVFVAGGRATALSAGAQITVASDATGQTQYDYASVARSADGDFVVTWSELGPTTGSWDVYARWYAATGAPMPTFNNPTGAAFRVNTTVTSVQRYSTVSMDNQGDAVIVWQSLNQDGSGYGVYLERYNPAGIPVGGTDQVELLTFTNNPVGTFTLQWNGATTGAIAYKGNTAAITATIQSALATLGLTVQVTAVSGTQILLTFIGQDAAKPVTPIYLAGQSLNASSGPGAVISLKVTVNGATGETLVNDTTAGNQTFPDVSMAENGSFVVTWMSSGEAAGDTASETSIYAKQFASNASLTNTESLELPQKYYTNSDLSQAARADLKILTETGVQNPVAAGGPYDGVVSITAYSTLGEDIGSGSLLSNGLDILTAAHVVWDDILDQPVGSVDVSFDLPTGRFTVSSSDIIVNPGWNPNALGVGDVAIIVLPGLAPAAAERYQIYTGAEVGATAQIMTIVGYGVTGSGTAGETGTDAGNVKNSAENVYQADGSSFNTIPWTQLGVDQAGTPDFAPGSLLCYCFYNGVAANDAFKILFGVNSAFLGNAEGSSAHGDSGGPIFLPNGQIAGITDFGLAPVKSSLDPADPSFEGFGTVSFDSSVTYYSAWIQSVMGATSVAHSEFLVNQTTTGSRMWPAVATDAQGDFVITWTSYGQDGGGSGYGAGYNGENGVYARRYSNQGAAVSNEFLVNTYTANNQQHSSVAMDSAGDFTITWESYQERQQNTSGTNSDVPINYGIYAQRFARASELGIDPSLGPNGQISGEVHVNSVTTGDQRYPSAAMDNTGDFIIDWFGPSSSPSPEGVFIQRFDQSSDTAGPVVGKVLNDSPASTTLSVAMSASVKQMTVASNVGFPTGNQLFNVLVGGEEMTVTAVANVGSGAVWTVKRGINEKPIKHAAGASVTLLLPTYPVVLNGITETGAVTALVVSFDEEMSTVGGPLGFNSVLNTANWTISYNGVVISGGVAAVKSDGTATSIYNPATGKYDVTVHFASQVAGVLGLSEQGTFVLTISQNVQDAFGNALDGNLDGLPGGNYTLTFNIVKNGSAVPPPPIPPPPGPPSPPGTPGGYTTDTPINLATQQPNIYPAVATDAAGDYVVVWESYQGIIGERFNKYGIAQGGQFVVNNSVDAGAQTEPDVAMDAYGDFVVTWCGAGSQDLNGVYARIYDSAGNPLANQFLVNTYTPGDANQQPKVAMDATGDFVIAWSGYLPGAFNNQQEIYYQRYNFSGKQLTAKQTLATSVTGVAESNPDVAVDSAGDFVVVWQQASGSGTGIYAQEFTAAKGFAGKGQFLVNTPITGNDSDPSVAMDAAGAFVVAWDNFGNDGGGYGIYTRRFSAAGVAQGAVTLVNQTTANWQMDPQVSMDSTTGAYAVAWTTFGEPGYTTVYSVFARTYSASGVATRGEFPVDASTLLNSGYLDVTAFHTSLPTNVNPQAPDIAMDAYGNFVVAWGSWNTGTGATNVYARKMVVNDAPFNLPAQSTTQAAATSGLSSSKASTTTTTTTTTKPPTTTSTKPPTTTSTKPPTTTSTKPPTTTSTKPPTTTSTKPPTTTSTKPPTTTITKPPTTTTTKPPTTTAKPPATTTTKSPMVTTTTAKPATTTTTKPATTTKPPTRSSTTAPKAPTTNTVVKAAVVASTSTVSSPSAAATRSSAQSAIDQALKAWK